MNQPPIQIDSIQKEIITLPMHGKTVYLYFDKLEDYIDSDSLTRIDYANIHAELITIPTLLNKVGILRAEAESIYKKAELTRRINAAKSRERLQVELTKIVTLAGGKTREKDPTVDDLAAGIRREKTFKINSTQEIESQRVYGIFDSLYWAVKSKSDKLDNISKSMSLTPEDFANEITEGLWNGILIKVHNNV